MTTFKSAQSMKGEIVIGVMEQAEIAIADSQLAIYDAMNKGESSVLTIHNLDFDSVLEINEFDRLVTIKFRELGFNAVVVHNTSEESTTIAITWVLH